jgi:hypothetical protein
MLGSAALAAGQSDTSTLKIVGPNRFTLDPACNAHVGAPFDLQVRNVSTRAVVLDPQPGPLVSKPPGKTMIAVTTLKFLDNNGKEIPDTTSKSLAVGETLWLRAKLSGDLEEGEWEAELRNGLTPFGTLTVVSSHIPFNIKLDVSTPDNPEILLLYGKAIRIPLKNEDGVGYLVRGEYSVKGKPVFTSGTVIVPAKGPAEIPLRPRDDWFPVSLLQASFKDEVVDGRLTIRLHSPHCPTDTGSPGRLFKVKTTLAMFPASTREAWSTGILFLMLLLGGVSSLFLNYAFPSHSRRLRLKTALSRSSGRIDDLPVQMDSATRMRMVVEHRQLMARVRNLKWFDTQSPAEMAEIDRGLERLRLRLDIIEEGEMTLNRYWRRRARVLPLNVVDDIEEIRRQGQDILRRSDPADVDIQIARALIKRMAESLGTATAANADLASRMVKQIAELKGQYDTANGEIGRSPIWGEIRVALGRTFDEVLGANTPTTAEGISPADYSVLGRSIFILEAIRDFLRLCSGTGPNATLSTDHRVLMKKLIDYLGGGSWEDLKRAERLVRRMRENISEQDVETAITRGHVRVEMSRSVVRQFESTEFRLVFDDRRVHGSVAREDFTYRWDFGHDGLAEPGWAVWHYFPEATQSEPLSSGTWLTKVGNLVVSTFGRAGQQGEVKQRRFLPAYKLKVTFIKLDGQPVNAVTERLVEVRPPLRVTVRASLWMEVLRMLLALGIAAAGLIAGAREQILKLDVLPALIAVFLLGFGSDRLKNIFSAQASPATDEAKPQTKPEGSGATPR